MVRLTNRIMKMISKYLFIIVLVMSLAHVGIAYIHSRESGRAD